MHSLSVAWLVALGCGSKNSDPSASTPAPSSTSNDGTTSGNALGGQNAPGGKSPSGGNNGNSGSTNDGGITTGITTVFTVVFENHDYNEVVGSKDAPFFNDLIAKYGLATNYSDCNIHPSLPNYLCMISGKPQYVGKIDLGPSAFYGTGMFPVNQDNLGGQLVAAGIPWRSYQESMGTPCSLDDASPYAPKHDPFRISRTSKKRPTSSARKPTSITRVWTPI